MGFILDSLLIFYSMCGSLVQPQCHPDTGHKAPYARCQWRLSILLFGGITPHFSPDYTCENFFMKKYLTTALLWGLGFCMAWERVWVDDKIEVRTGHSIALTAQP